MNSILCSDSQPPAQVMRDLRKEVGFSESDLCRLVGKPRSVVRRWCKEPASAELSEANAKAIEALRAMVVLLASVDYPNDEIKRFFRSRNIGLGRDRPLDGLRVGAFEEVKDVTKCFGYGIKPEPGSSVVKMYHRF